jgi:NAD(P)-dependent dehydrogenase (short-subunit alcohol dehydrogenase family)
VSSEVPHRLEPAGRVVMISGASRGIGAAIARRLHDDGFTLSLGVRDPKRSAAAFGDHDGARVMFARFDALEPPTAAGWIEATLARFGRLDGLINNAGIYRKLSFAEGDESILDELWAVNVKAPFRLIRLALPHLAPSGNGRIVNVASTDGKRYRDASVSIAYAMTKHALVALSHAARFAGWDHGVRVTALCPGAVDTDLTRGLAGATAAAQRLSPKTVAEIVSLLLHLPNNASVAELVVNTRLEATI